MYILGLSCFYHDSAACIVQDGKILAAAQEERFTRKKHDPSFPRNAFFFCLDKAKISVKELDYVVYYDKPFLTFDRLLFSYLSIAPKGIASWLNAMPLWLGKKLDMRKVIRKETSFEGDMLFTEHHESHAASAFYPSPFSEAAILTVDGVGEWATGSYGYGRGKDITLIKELHFPDSLGLLYSAFTYFCGFKVNSGEYKLMGLAPYGRPIYKNIILSEIVDIKDDGSLRLNLSYFDFMGGMKMTNKNFAKLFGGPPRRPEGEIKTREVDLAASIQAVTEEAMLKMAWHVHRETKLDKLCLAGGVALNCTSNGRLLKEGPFKEIWIQPAAGDAGGALGAALSVWHRYLGNERKIQNNRDSQQGSLLGPTYSNDYIKAYLDANFYPNHLMKKDERAMTVARMIADGKIVGYLAGRMEFGPRALGARSILGDARREDMQSKMNLKIKYRESFRPFAPSIIEEKTMRYFEIDQTSPYMLFIASLKKELRKNMEISDCQGILERLKVSRSEIPAVTHVDYTARLQTVGREDNPGYYEIIAKFEELTGCPLIVNTSFNVRGEPIVCTPDDAYKCFMRTDMDILILEDYILFKEEQPAWTEGKKWKDDLVLD